MKKNWKMIVGLVLLIIVVIFAAMNMERTTVNFGFTQLQQPLIILILASTLIGAVIVALFSSATLFSRNHKIKMLEKENKQLKEENKENELQQQIDHLQQELAAKDKEIEQLNPSKKIEG